MRATLIYGAGDIRVEDVPDAGLVEPTDALVRITRACICGSDLWPYQQREPTGPGERIGHEFLGVVDEVGSQVSGFRPGDVVVAPFLISDGTCEFCREGLTSSCRHGGMWGGAGDGGQGEAARVPLADGTLVRLPVEPDDERMPSLLTLSDVFATGHHAAVSAGVGPGSTVTVIGDGAVGLSAVLAAARLGAEQIVLMGRHPARTDLGREFGADEVVTERGDDGAARVRDLTGGDGTSAVLECVGTEQALEMALGAVRAGGAVSRVGLPQYEKGRLDVAHVFFRNVSLGGGVAPSRAYIPELLPDVLAGRVEPGRVFDRTIGLDEVPDGYRAMNDREALKVLITP
ncbi:alcohol dehydrogenase catalytic domain-containing protein [Saccharopolyspora sp. HNM0983]|uniref:Alcohol dehydrogenase catalytic domain-containing protein n=1 Tax=Saccharopolyspora montiporae TaxID=2781240 RepID=A0A929B7N4_9PSEU|nr:alcohol dehydrogenase catalytic domain-containing protein [Saccharopolyspora sp. HNM0983]MBE9372926.1 alcohol dehydrogenase catalytic domain-containing protein [Saccharopolyspora sp. HNM0983]